MERGYGTISFREMNAHTNMALPQLRAVVQVANIVGERTLVRARNCHMTDPISGDACRETPGQLLNGIALSKLTVSGHSWRHA